MTMLMTFVSLFKLRIVGLLVLLSVAAIILAGAGGGPSAARVTLLVAAGTLACAGASAANNFLDRDIDGAMRRTRARALARGTIAPNAALALSLGLMAAAIAISLTLNVATAVYVFLGAFTYVILYTWLLKRRTPFNIVVGGAAGSFAVLAGWSAAGASVVAPVPLLLALLLFLWTPAHFWAFAIVHRDDYRRAGVPMLPVVAGAAATANWVLAHTIGVALSGALAAVAAGSSRAGVVLTTLLGVAFSISAALLAVDRSRRTAWRHYKLSGIYLLLVFLVLAADKLIAG